MLAIKTPDVSPPGAAGSPGRDVAEEWIVPLARAALVVAVALLGGIVAALLVARSGVGNDPADVVGVPLLDGYSESLEQWSFYTFILAAGALGAILSRRGTMAWIPPAVLVPAGALAMLVPACLPAWCAWPATLPVATLAAVLAFRAGATWAGRGWGSAGHAGRALAVALLIWGVGFPELPVTLLGSAPYALAAALAALAFRHYSPKLPGAIRGEPADWRHAAAALLVICGTLIANDREFRLGVIGALGFLLGRRARARRRGPSPLGGPEWLAFLAVMGISFYLVHQWTSLGPARAARAVAGGAGGAAVLALALPSRPKDGLGAFDPAARRWWGRWLPLLSLGGLALVNATRPWFGLLVVGGAFAIARLRPRRVWRLAGAFALAGALWLAVLPGPPLTTIDPFHDGQILSAVWEFESGRPLYAEVFPLRSYEFFLTWLSRRIAEPSLGNYFVANHLLDALPIAGVFLLTFAWTRAPSWSFATALAAATYGLMDSRMGLPLLLAALGVAAFRARRRWSGLAALAVGGGVAAPLGFDMLIPLVGASVLTVLIAGPPGRTPVPWGAGPGPAAIRRALGRVGWSASLFLAATIPFLALLGLGQGSGAARAYVGLLVDNARNLPAFYGLPLPWGVVEQRLRMTAALAVIGTWAAVGALAWPSLNGPRRRAGLFLLASYVLTAHRGLGRSDPAHLDILVFPNLVLGSLLLFEGLRLLGRRGVGRPLTDRRALSFVAMVAFCGMIPLGRTGPGDVLRWVREVSGRADPAPAVSASVLGRVGSHDFLWEMEGGMMGYAYGRHNPTRHALAYCISSPAEQRVAVAALRARPPRLIAWQYLSGSNGIPNPLRHYVISQHLYRHFRPVLLAGAAFLEPAPPGWRGQVELEPVFNGPLPLRHLAHQWGRRRLSRLAGGVRGRQPLAPWGEAAPAGVGVRTWESRSAIDPRSMNYLRLDLACRAVGAPAPGSEVEAVVEFAPAGRGYDAAARVSFVVLADGTMSPYLIPIGCSPGWSWRPGLDRIRLSLPAGQRLDGLRAECWSVDETAPSPSRPLRPRDPAGPPRSSCHVPGRPGGED